MTEPKVSILVPIYNVEAYIEQCVRSLFEQTWGNCEYIFVNDCTPDGSIEVLRRVASDYPNRATEIKIIDHEHNCGVATARNTALDNATGDYILFVDSDDYVKTDLVSRVVALATQSGADITNCGYSNVSADQHCVNVCSPWVGDNVASARAVLGQSHIVHNHIHGMLIRRSLWEEHHIRFTPHIDFGEDYSVLPQLLYFAQGLANIADFLYIYRTQNAGSYMNNIREKHIRNYVDANVIISDFYYSRPDYASYRRAVIMGKLNIKKWVIKRGYSPAPYDPILFDDRYPLTGCLERLYNRILNCNNLLSARLAAAVMNLPLFVRFYIVNFRAKHRL